MLQILRNKAQSIVIQAIVVIIALVFIFWGVGTNLMNNREAAIVVNGTEISFPEFQKAYDRAYDNLRNQFGGSIPKGLAESLNIKGQVVNQLIQEELLRQGARKMGLHVSHEEVRDTITNMVQFQENGSFSMEKYQSLLAANGYAPTAFEETVRFDMLAQKARLNISEFATNATEYEIEDLRRLEKSEVAVRYVKVEPAAYMDTVTVDDDKLQEWFSEHKENYKTEPQVKLKYLDFSYKNVGKKVSIDQADVEAYYKKNQQQFTEPEQRKARHILFKADENSSAEVHEKQRQKAEEILAMARQGADFSELAKQYSEGPTKSRGGDLGFFSRNQMVKPFEEAAFALKKGEISDVVKTPFGYHIIKVEDIRPSTVKPLAEVEDTIRNDLQIEQAKPLSFQVANEAYEGIIGAGSLDAYLKANPGTEVQETGFFPKSDPPADIRGDQKFLNTAFSLKEGELSSLIETSRGYAILYAEAVKEPQVPELEAVKEQVTKDYREESASTAARESAESLLEKAKETGSLSEAAEAGGFTVEDSDYLSKSSAQQSSLPQSIIDAAFTLSVSSPLPEHIAEAGDGFYVYEFLDKKLPQGPMSEEEKNRYRNALVQMKQQQVLSGWLANQRKKAEVYTHKML